MANFKKYTRYTNGHTAKNRSNQSFLVLRSALNLPPDSGDVTVSVTQELVSRPDLIAFKAYGNIDLWWVIYEYNNIKDPLFELKIGQIIKIPDIKRVRVAINQLGTQ
jgi:hypothetical protein